jgi:dihydroxy-acid dehydratase
MPEMFTPMQHINANSKLKRMATLISDGRYSGVTYGAAVGHMTPEAYQGGGILYLQTGDLVYLSLRDREIHFLNVEAFRNGKVEFSFDSIPQERATLGEERMQSMRIRQKQVASSNRMVAHTDAANGVVPIAVYDDADLDYRKDILFPSVNKIVER